MEVLSLLSDDVETDNAGPGENLKLRLKGIEEEEILPGFILCNAENLCHSGRIFDAQVSVALHTWVKILKFKGDMLVLVCMTNNVYQGIFQNCISFTVYNTMFFFHGQLGVNYIFK